MDTVCKFEKFFPHDILEKFRQINFFTKELYCKSIWRKIFAVGENFRNFHPVWALVTQFHEFFREINYENFSVLI